MKHKTEITWNEALEIRKEQQKIKEQIDEEYQENVNSAYDDFQSALESDNFRFSDFDDICYNWGIDSDDLLDRII